MGLSASSLQGKLSCEQYSNHYWTADTRVRVRCTAQVRKVDGVGGAVRERGREVVRVERGEERVGVRVRGELGVGGGEREALCATVSSAACGQAVGRVLPDTAELLEKGLLSARCACLFTS